MFLNRKIIAALGLLTFSTSSACLPPHQYPASPAELAPHPLVREARRLRDARYEFGGRMKDGADPTIDCMGLVFLAYQQVYGTRWQQHSPTPTKLIPRGTLGTPVEGFEGIPNDAIEYDKLQPGDIVFVLRHEKNPKEPALAKLNGDDAWVWHMGIYSGGKQRRLLHADPFHECVVEVPLDAYLSNVWYGNDGIYVVRPPTPR